MYNSPISLDLSSPGSEYVISKINARNACYSRLTDLGIVPGTRIKAIGKSPLGDPAAYFVKGTVIALRNSDSKNITVTKIKSQATDI